MNVLLEISLVNTDLVKCYQIKEISGKKSKFHFSINYFCPEFENSFFFRKELNRLNKKVFGFVTIGFWH